MIEHLAYLCGEYPRTTDTFIQREVASLRKAGFYIETISVRRPARKEQGTKEQEKERERTFYLLPCSPWRLFSDHFGLLIRSPIRYLSGLRSALTIRSPGLRSWWYQLFYFAEAGLVAARMRKHGLTHIHNHAPDASGYVTMLASEIGGITYSMTLHGFGIFSEPSRWSLQEKIERSLFTICVSYHGMSLAMLWSGRQFWDRLHVVHCGINPDNFTVRTHKGHAQNLLFVGRLDHVKGLPILLEAFSNLADHDPEIHLQIVGDGPIRPNLEAIVTTMGLNNRVSFYGYQSQEELLGHFSNADIFIMTSFVEGIPVVLMESMASGIPVIAPQITGIPELVQDEVCGLLTRPGDVASLVNRIESLLNDPEKRNRFGIAGRQFVEKEFNLVIESEYLSIIMHKALEDFRCSTGS